MTMRVYKPDRSYRVNSGQPCTWAADPFLREVKYNSMAHYYTLGYHDNEIAEHTGVSTQTVYRWRHRTGRKAFPK
jgi:transposase-like protein